MPIDPISLAAMARRHWTQYLPEKSEQLRNAGEFASATQAAANRAHEEILSLMQLGYQAHEAEEVALRTYILLPEEPIDDWESEELAQMEADYQEMMAAGERAARMTPDD